MAALAGLLRRRAGDRSQDEAQWPTAVLPALGRWASTTSGVNSFPVVPGRHQDVFRRAPAAASHSLALALGGEGRAEVSPQTPPFLFIQTSPSKNLPPFCSITLPSVSRTMLWSKSGA